MINNISWISYWQFIVIAALIYYVFVFYFYFRRDIVNLFVHNRNPLSTGSLQPSPPKNFNTENKQLYSENTNSDSALLVQSVVDEITAYLEQAGHAGVVKEEIIFSLKRILEKYSALRFTEHQLAINSLIRMECADKCSFQLDDDDLNSVWKG